MTPRSTSKKRGSPLQLALLLEADEVSCQRQRGDNGPADSVGALKWYRRRVPSIFLSHAHQDEAVAARLHARLASEGIFSWLAEAELLPGDSLISKIQAALTEVDYVAVLLSPASVASSWVIKEVQVALNEEISGRRVKVIPILVEPCAIPPFLSDKLYADLTGDFEAGLGKLLQRLAPNRPGSDVRRSHAQRLLSLGYDRWNLANQADRQLLDPTDLEELLPHIEVATLAPHVLTYLVRSVVSALVLTDLNSQPVTLEDGPLATRLAGMAPDALRREFAPLFAHEETKVRLGAVYLLATVDGGAELLLEVAQREPDGYVRSIIFAELDKQHRMTPEIARSILDSDEPDFSIVARALRHDREVAGALVVSDGTELSSEITALVRSAGYRAATVSGQSIMTRELSGIRTPFSPFRLLVLVRGEGYSRGLAWDRYKWVAEYVQQGGNVLATSWVAWEADGAPDYEAVSPVVLLDSSFIEDETRSVRLPTGEELRVSGSFERLSLRPGAESWASFTDGSPLLAVRRVGAGTSVYLNVCQHSCRGSAPSPFRRAPALAEVVGATLRWLRAERSQRPEAPSWAPG